MDYYQKRASSLRIETFLIHGFCAPPFPPRTPFIPFLQKGFLTTFFSSSLVFPFLSPHSLRINTLPVRVHYVLLSSHKLIYLLTSTTLPLVELIHLRNLSPATFSFTFVSNFGRISLHKQPCLSDLRQTSTHDSPTKPSNLLPKAKPRLTFPWSRCIMIAMDSSVLRQPH